MVRGPGFCAVIEEETGGPDNGNGVEGKTDDPADDGLFREAFQWPCQELSQLLPVPFPLFDLTSRRDEFSQALAEEYLVDGQQGGYM